MSYFASWHQKRNLSIFFVWVRTIISFDHTFKLPWNKGDIVAVSFRFLTHIEWPRGSAYLLIYLQFGDRYFNTDFRWVRFTPVKYGQNMKLRRRKSKIKTINVKNTMNVKKMMYICEKHDVHYVKATSAMYQYSNFQIKTKNRKREPSGSKSTMQGLASR